jgi:hypothetical protein
MDAQMTYLETWKQISTHLRRSERWCRAMARRPFSPLPVYRLGGIVRLQLEDLDAWLHAERARTIMTGPRLAA